LKLFFAVVAVVQEALLVQLQEQVAVAVQFFMTC
jgi:hypothetical protein